MAAGGEVFDVPYAAGPRHGMDIYAPAPGQTRPPVVVFFYGGGWTHGERAGYRFVGRTLAACGIMTFVPDYRVWPETGFPGFLRDGAAAVVAARDEAARRGADTSRLFLMGHSAGAHIAAMLALDPAWLRGAGAEPRGTLAGVVGISGPYDFLPLKGRVLKQIFDPAGPETQPITFAANAVAPMLLLTGGSDGTVQPGNSLRLAARVRESGGRADTIVYPFVGHAAVIAAMAAPLRFLAPVRDDVCRFIGAAPPAMAAAPSIDMADAR